ncbi:hypothetical protein DK847_19985 [Aestuariivirga litoralis]|uniref:Uncharacterized protein n=1 Tax=Aestuariivirga litoralis TaxID=2650924 RepID=A0A2W2ARL8_9HYPH|nr:hypothetical protein DK847_19985 [Aestuariivirga litoralis]
MKPARTEGVVQKVRLSDPDALSREQAEMWEISDTLHCVELRLVQRSEQVSRWVELAEQVLAQVAPRPQGGRPELRTQISPRPG